MSTYNLRPKTRSVSAIVAVMLLFGAYGCKSTFEKVGKNIGSGVVKEIKHQDTKIDTLVNGIVSHLRDNALGDTTRLRIDSLIQAVTVKLGHSADSLTTSVRDSLLSEYTALRVKRIVLEAGDGLTTSGGRLREQLLGARTRLLVEKLRNDLLGDSTLLAVANIREELIGSQTKALVDSLLKHSITTIARGFKEEISPEIRGTLDDTQHTVEGTVKYIAWALGTVVAVLAFVTALFWRKFLPEKRLCAF